MRIHQAQNNGLNKAEYWLTIPIIFIGFFVFISLNPIASYSQEKNPKIANYFLKTSITDDEVVQLSKWDLLILDMENQINNPEKIQKIRSLNPKIKILAYITAQELKNTCNPDEKLRCKLISQINDSQYLKDSSGKKLCFWPGSSMINIADENLDNILINFVKNDIYSSGLWDGIFYDNVWETISWMNNGDVDIDTDSDIDSKDFIDMLWKNGVLRILSQTRALTSNNFLIVGNSTNDINLNSQLNGRMFENFGKNSQWKNIAMSYLSSLPKTNLYPHIYIINSNTENLGNQNDYQKMRYGLTSMLMGDNGYFSFDFGDKDHSQTWLYDEYNTKLGNATSDAKNLSGKNTDVGLWRRDFENGVAFVNSSNKSKWYVFANETFERIKGTQDTKTNDGLKVNYVILKPYDGIILTKTNLEIINSVYNNSTFFRVFDSSGKQIKSPFFASLTDFYANTKILLFDINNDSKDEIITSKNGVLSIYNQSRKKITTFYPYDKNYKGQINFVVADINNDSKNEIITGADTNGPHIRIFDEKGNVLNQFFAYDKNSRGGVSVAVGDVNKDNVIEIITGSRYETEPKIKIFNKDGILLKEFPAYEKDFRGGVNVSVGDVNGDNEKEIISAPKKDGGSHIQIFNSNGKILNQFFAYDKNFRGDINITVNDINKDNVDEILVGTNNF